MNQHGAVGPPSRLDARAVQECLFFTSTLQLDSTHLAGDAELEQFFTGDKATAQVLAFNIRIDLKS